MNKEIFIQRGLHYCDSCQHFWNCGFKECKSGDGDKTHGCFECCPDILKLYPEAHRVMDFHVHVKLHLTCSPDGTFLATLTSGPTQVTINRFHHLEMDRTLGPALLRLINEVRPHEISL